MSTSIRLLTAPLLAMLLAACDSDTNFNSGASGQSPALPSASGTVVVLHASSDAPAVNVLFNGTERISNLPYKAISTLRLAPGDQSVRVNGRLPGGATATVIPSAGPDPVVPIADGDQVSIIALGDVAGITAQVVVDTDPEVPAGSVRLRVLHAAPAVGTVQVWLSEPNAVLDAADPAVITADFGFNTFLTADPLQIPAGSYQVRVTPSLADTTVLYDSGAIALPSGGNLLLAAVPNTGAGTAPVSLIASTGSALLEFLDVDTPSNVRVVHAASDAPAVDVLVNGNASGIAGLTFGNAAGPAPLVPGPTDFDVVASPAGPGSVPVISATANLVQGGGASVFAVGSLSVDPANPIEALLLADETRTVATEARVRIVHASVLAQDVDIYVLPGGSLAPASDIPADVSPSFAGVPFKADTGYIALADGDYDIAVTPAGSRTPAIGPATLTFSAGDLLTLIALDGPNLTTPLGVQILDDSL